MAIYNRLTPKFGIQTQPSEVPYVDDIFDPLFNKEVIDYYNNIYGNRLLGIGAGYTQMIDNALTGRKGILGPGMGILSTFGRSMDKADDAILGTLTEGVNAVGNLFGGTNPAPTNPITNIFRNDYDYTGTKLLAAMGNSMAKLAGTQRPLTEADFDSFGDRITGTMLDLATDPGYSGGTLARLKPNTPVGQVGQILSNYDDIMANVAGNMVVPGGKALVTKNVERLFNYITGSASSKPYQNTVIKSQIEPADISFNSPSSSTRSQSTDDFVDSLANVPDDVLAAAAKQMQDLKNAGRINPVDDPEAYKQIALVTEAFNRRNTVKAPSGLELVGLMDGPGQAPIYRPSYVDSFDKDYYDKIFYDNATEVQKSMFKDMNDNIANGVLSYRTPRFDLGKLFTTDEYGNVVMDTNARFELEDLIDLNADKTYASDGFTGLDVTTDSNEYGDFEDIDDNFIYDRNVINNLAMQHFENLKNNFNAAYDQKIKDLENDIALTETIYLTNPDNNDVMSKVMKNKSNNLEDLKRRYEDFNSGDIYSSNAYYTAMDMAYKDLLEGKVDISSKLRKEIEGYINKHRVVPDSKSNFYISSSAAEFADKNKASLIKAINNRTKQLLSKHREELKGLNLNNPRATAEGIRTMLQRKLTATSIPAESVPKVLNRWTNTNQNMFDSIFFLKHNADKLSWSTRKQLLAERTYWLKENTAKNAIKKAYEDYFGLSMDKIINNTTEKDWEPLNKLSEMVQDLKMVNDENIKQFDYKQTYTIKDIDNLLKENPKLNDFVHNIAIDRTYINPRVIDVINPKKVKSNDFISVFTNKEGTGIADTVLKNKSWITNLKENSLDVDLIAWAEDVKDLYNKSSNFKNYPESEGFMGFDKLSSYYDINVPNSVKGYNNLTSGFKSGGVYLKSGKTVTYEDTDLTPQAKFASYIVKNNTDNLNKRNLVKGFGNTEMCTLTIPDDIYDKFYEAGQYGGASWLKSFMNKFSIVSREKGVTTLVIPANSKELKALQGLSPNTQTITNNEALALFNQNPKNTYTPEPKQLVDNSIYNYLMDLDPTTPGVMYHDKNDYDKAMVDYEANVTKYNNKINDFNTKLDNLYASNQRPGYRKTMDELANAEASNLTEDALTLKNNKVPNNITVKNPIKVAKPIKEDLQTANLTTKVQNTTPEVFTNTILDNTSQQRLTIDSLTNSVFGDYINSWGISPEELGDHIKVYGSGKDKYLFDLLNDEISTSLYNKTEIRRGVDRLPQMEALKRKAQKLKGKYENGIPEEYLNYKSTLDERVIKGSDMYSYLADSNGWVSTRTKDKKLASSLYGSIKRNVDKINTEAGSEILKAVGVKHKDGTMTIGYTFNVQNKNIKRAYGKLESIFGNKLQLEDMTFGTKGVRNAALDAKYQDLDAFFDETRQLSEYLSKQLGFTSFNDNYIKYAMRDDLEAAKFFSEYAKECGIDLDSLGQITDALKDFRKRGTFSTYNYNRAYLGDFSMYAPGYSKDIDYILSSTFTKGMLDNTNTQTYVDLFLSQNFALRNNFDSVDSLKNALRVKDSSKHYYGNITNLDVLAPKFNADGKLTGFIHYDKFDDASLEEAFKNPQAILAPDSVVVELDAICKRDKRMSNKFVKFMNKYLTVPFKFATLCNPGFLAGNIQDAYFKQAAEMAKKYNTTLSDELAEVAMSMRQVTVLNNQFADSFNDYLTFLKDGKPDKNIYGKSIAYAKSGALTPAVVMNNPDHLKCWTAYINSMPRDTAQQMANWRINKFYTFLNVRQNTSTFANNNNDLADVVDAMRKNPYDVPMNAVERVFYGDKNQRGFKSWGLFVNNPIGNEILQKSNQIEVWMRSASILNDLKHQGYDVDKISDILALDKGTERKMLDELRIKMDEATNTMNSINFDYNKLSPTLAAMSYVIPFPTFYLKNLGYWADMLAQRPQMIDNIISVHENMWSGKDTKKDEFAAEAKGRGAVPIGKLFGNKHLTGIVKQTPYNSMFGAFNAVNNFKEDAAYRFNPALRPITRHLQNPEDIKYRPYSTNVYEKNINQNSPQFSELAYMFHQLNPYERTINTALRTPRKIATNDYQISDFLPSMIQPDFSKK